MVTLAFGIVVEKLVGEWTEVFGGAQGIYGIKPLTWNGQPLSSLQWVWFGVVLCAVDPPAAAQPAAGPLRPRAAVAAGRRDRVVVGRRARLPRQGHGLRGCRRDLRHRRRAGRAAEPVHQLRLHHLPPVDLHPAAGAVRRRGLDVRAAGRRGAPDAGRRAACALAVGAAFPLRLPAAVRALRHAGRRGRAVREVVQAAREAEPRRRRRTRAGRRASARAGSGRTAGGRKASPRPTAA